MRATFIRHAESFGNAGAVTSDVARISLTETGQEQSRTLAALWNESPSLIVFSPFLRTRLTAQPTIQRFPEVRVQEWPVQEFTYLEPSRWNGTAREERLTAVEAWWESADPSFLDGPGAESFSDLLRRAEDTLTRLERQPPESRVLVFTHGQFMQALGLTVIFPEKTDEQKMAMFRQFDREHPLKNCAMFSIDRPLEGSWRIELGVKANDPVEEGERT